MKLNKEDTQGYIIFLESSFKEKDKTIEQQASRITKLEKVVEAAKEVPWRHVIIAEPRVIWWRSEHWLAYGRFEKALTELSQDNK